MTDPLSSLTVDQLAEKVRGLRNLREGYSLAYAVDRR